MKGMGRAPQPAQSICPAFVFKGEDPYYSASDRRANALRSAPAKATSTITSSIPSTPSRIPSTPSTLPVATPIIPPIPPHVIAIGDSAKRVEARFQPSRPLIPFSSSGLGIDFQTRGYHRLGRDDLLYCQPLRCQVHPSPQRGPRSNRPRQAGNGSNLVVQRRLCYPDIFYRRWNRTVARSSCQAMGIGVPDSTLGTSRAPTAT